MKKINIWGWIAAFMLLGIIRVCLQCHPERSPGVYKKEVRGHSVYLRWDTTTVATRLPLDTIKIEAK